MAYNNVIPASALAALAKAGAPVLTTAAVTADEVRRRIADRITAPVRPQPGEMTSAQEETIAEVRRRASAQTDAAITSTRYRLDRIASSTHPDDITPPAPDAFTAAGEAIAAKVLGKGPPLTIPGLSANVKVPGIWAEVRWPVAVSPLAAEPDGDADVR